jgi:hypothetical protein
MAAVNAGAAHADTARGKGRRYLRPFPEVRRLGFAAAAGLSKFGSGIS